MLQLGIIVAMLSLNGLFSELRQNALSTLEERTQNKYQNLQMQMKTEWAYLAGSVERVQGIITETLAQEGKTFADIADDPALNRQLTLAVAPELISRIRSNCTAGVFLILDGPGAAEEGDSYAGVYLRDDNPDEVDVDNLDLRVVRGYAEIADALGITQDGLWQDFLTFPGGSDNTANDFFYQPLLVAQSARALGPGNDGYWSLPFRLNGEGDGEIITYSEPLVSREGVVYGVLGVEINLAQINDMLSNGEFARAGKACYFLGVSQDGGASYQKITAGGSMYQRFFGAEETSLRLASITQEGHITIQSTLKDEIMLGSLQELQMYTQSSSFSSQQWTLFGMADETTLYSFENTIRKVFVMAAALAVLLGVGVAAITSRHIACPIVRLANSLKNTDPNEKLTLEPTNIREIDQLANAMMTLNHEAIESATRLSKILKLAGLNIGVFKIRNN
ncbi:MAG: cache domain-containing protein, partial [Eubacteriales bacterium]|nr:cache domain-containing protein [Eubacteriales bacterium]